MLKQYIANKIAGLVRNVMRAEMARTRPYMEPVYQGIVMRDLARMNVPDVYYPVGIAVNYGLLYVLLRSIQEFPLKHIVELGGGQSTLLLDAASRAGALKATVTTIESDEEFARHLANRVNHRVIFSELRERRFDGISFRGFDLSKCDLGDVPIDLLIVDGPVAATPDTCFNRLGALDLIKRIDQSGFIIIVDDAERAGDAKLGTMIGERLGADGLAYVGFDVISNKRQYILVGGRYRNAAYY